MLSKRHYQKGYNSKKSIILSEFRIYLKSCLFRIYNLSMRFRIYIEFRKVTWNYFEISKIDKKFSLKIFLCQIKFRRDSIVTVVQYVTVIVSHHTSMYTHIYACTLAVGLAPLNTLVLWSSYHRDIKLFGALSLPFPQFSIFLHHFFLHCKSFFTFNFAAVSSGYAD